MINKGISIIAAITARYSINGIQSKNTDANKSPQRLLDISLKPGKSIRQLSTCIDPVSQPLQFNMNKSGSPNANPYHINRTNTSVGILLLFMNENLKR
jgi:hypothetical protein